MNEADPDRKLPPIKQNIDKKSIHNVQPQNLSKNE